MKNIFLRISELIADHCFRFFVILFAIGNLFFSIERYLAIEGVFYRFVNITNVLITIFLLILFYIIMKNNFFNINSKKYLIIFLTFAASIGFLWIMMNSPESIEYDDSKNCIDAARKLYRGDWACVGYGSYVNTYPFQLTFITYLYILIKIFGDCYFLYAAKFLNLIYVLIGYIYLYKTTTLLFKNETINNIVVALMFLSSQYIYLCSLIYGTCLSHSFAIVSVYYVLKYLLEDDYKSLIPAGVTIALACAVKSNSLIILIAEIIFLIIHIIQKKRLINIVYIVLVFILYFAGSKGIQNYYSHKTETDYSNSLPTICWIAYGLNYDQNNPGGYMPNFEAYHHDNDYYSEGTIANAKWYINYVQSRFKEKPLLGFNYYAQKYAVSFCEPAYGVLNQQFAKSSYSFFADSLTKGKGYRILYEKWNATASIVAIGLLSYCFNKNRNKNFDELMVGVVVFGGFLFHMIWETKALYLIQYYLFLIPLAASGIYNLIKKNN